MNESLLQLQQQARLSAAEDFATLRSEVKQAAAAVMTQLPSAPSSPPVQLGTAGTAENETQVHARIHAQAAAQIAATKAVANTELHSLRCEYEAEVQAAHAKTAEAEARAVSSEVRLCRHCTVVIRVHGRWYYCQLLPIVYRSLSVGNQGLRCSQCDVPFSLVIFDLCVVYATQAELRRKQIQAQNAAFAEAEALARAQVRERRWVAAMLPTAGCLPQNICSTASNDFPLSCGNADANT